MVVFTQKSFEINLPPAHCFACRRKPHVNQHRVEHRLQIVYILSRVANGIELAFCRSPEATIICLFNTLRHLSA